MQSIRANNIEELKIAAEMILKETRKKPVVVFYGKMGSGKTTLIKSICEIMNVGNVVTSPTFALVNEYNSKNGEIIYHFDFYRVKKIEEIFDIGFEEYIYSGYYCFIEWPEIVEQLLPKDFLKVIIKEDEKGTRIISF
jgi:tRNA threonylcarbamoyladenosine biosynthesis protein TsaE